MSALAGLSRRERQIMEILYQHGKASASEVRELMESAPGYSAVRAMLRVLEEKGHVKHQAEGLKYVYVPTVAREKAKRSAEARAGYLFQWIAGADCGGAPGCLLHAVDARGTGPHGGNDRESQEGGKVNGEP